MRITVVGAILIVAAIIGAVLLIRALTERRASASDPKQPPMEQKARKVAALYARVSTSVRDARRRLFDVVLVWKFDRFARSLRHLIESLDEFSALGIDFISLTEGIDTTTSAGQLLFHIVGAVAQFERDLIAERVRAGMAHARAISKRIGRPRAAVDVEAVSKLRAEGRSLREIARTLDVPVSRVRRALLRLPTKTV